MPRKSIPHITNAKKVRLGYITAFLLLVVSLGLTNYITKKLIDQTNDVANTNAVINILEQTLSSVKDAETGVRGYFIMKDSIYLEPYNNSRHKVDSLYSLLKNQIASSESKEQRLQVLNRFIDKRFAIIRNALDTFEVHHHNTEIFLEKRLTNGKTMMDSLRLHVGAMQVYEKQELLVRQHKVNAIAAYINYISIASLIVSILLAFYAISTFNRENKARNEAGSKADDYQKQLEARVTELHSANTELNILRSNEKFATTGRIARTIAHEVRNPLTNINLALEQLQEDATQNTGTEALIEMIKRNSLRIQQLITDLLNSTRFTELHFTLTSVNHLLDEALALAQDRLHLHKIKVIKNYDTSFADLFIDAEKIKIGMLNIIVNAIEAMPPEKGILTISTGRQNNSCYIKVNDNGTGMDKETIQRLFEPYFTRKVKGNGLGMTNTQNIILNHKGLVSAESEVGKGTTFTIMLPFPAQEVSPFAVQ